MPRKIQTSTLYLLGISAFISGLSTACQKGYTPDKYNILVLFTDDQRFNTIRAWGNEEIITPNMDRLASMGVSFTRAHIPGGNSGAVCIPSRAMLLTGNPWWSLPGGFGNPRLLAQTEQESTLVTFPQWFLTQGYTTFFTGKWHNEPAAINKGFESGANIFIGGMHFLDEGGHTGPQLHSFDPTGKYAREQKHQVNRFSSELYAEALMDFIQNRPKGKPFLAYAAFTSPHDPRTPPDSFRALYDTADISMPPNYLPDHPFENGELRVRDEELLPHPRTPGAVKQEIANYYAMVSEVDAQIGRVLDVLKEQGLLDKTIIVFAGDNGLAVGQHGLLGKQSVYDHSIRVPLIIVAPGIKGGQRAETLCYLYDVFPTLCDLTGSGGPETVKGTSLLPALINTEEKTRIQTFMGYRQLQRAIRTDDNWKLIAYHNNSGNFLQVFNLNQDPWERQNLAGTPATSARQQDLTVRLVDQMHDIGDPFLTTEISAEYPGVQQPPIVTLAGPMDGMEIRYTLDGSEPSSVSPVFRSGFPIDSSCTIKAQLFFAGKKVGNLTKKLVERYAPLNK